MPAPKQEKSLGLFSSTVQKSRMVLPTKTGQAISSAGLVEENARQRQTCALFSTELLM